MVAQYVGIDVSKDKLDVYVHPSGRSLNVARTEAGLIELATALRGVSVAILAVEATAGYETLVVYSLTAAGLPAVIVNPAQVRQYARAWGKRAKTDALDAQVIARFAETMWPEVRPLPDDATRYLCGLMDRRRQIVGMIANNKQRERATTDAKLKRSITRVRRALEKELGRVDTDIDGQIGLFPEWKAQEDLLTPVPGVGIVSARAESCGTATMR